MALRLTVTVVTLDEERSLPRLLASVRGLADEVLVIDSGSTDGTVALARAAGARVVIRPWPGFREQKAFALAEATGDWVLNLDADEWLEPALARAIRAELDRPGGPRRAAYRIHFRHRALGRRVRFGAFGWDSRVRLVRRDTARYGGTAVHPRLLHPGRPGTLPGRCGHDGFQDASEASAKLSRYAEQLARERYRSGRRWRPWDALRGPWGFLRRYLLLLGLLDGRAGLTLALLYARYDADKARWLRRLDGEVGGAAPRAHLAEALRGLGRRLIVALASAALPRPDRALPAPASIRRLLVVRQDERVGNLLLTTPLLRALRAGLPQAELHVLAAPRASRALPARLCDRLHRFDKRAALRRPWRLWALLRELRAARFDLVVEAGHWSGASLTASLLARLAAAEAPIIGHARDDSPRFLSHPVSHDPANANEAQARLELLRPLGLWPQGLEPETDLGLSPSARAAAAAALAVAGLRGPYAVLCPGARRADRRGAPASWAAAARGLRERGLTPLLAWGPGEEALARAVADASGAALAPPTDLDALAALLREARLCLAANSGPMHLSVACGAPTVGVFLAGDAARWGHLLPSFEPAEPRGEDDGVALLAACDRLLARTLPRSEAAPVG